MDFLLGPPFDIATMASNNLKPPIRFVTTAVVIEGISRGSVTWTNSFTLLDVYKRQPCEKASPAGRTDRALGIGILKHHPFGCQPVQNGRADPFISHTAQGIRPLLIRTDP